MNKANLIDVLAQDGGLTKVKAGEVVDLVFNTITKSLKKGESVTLVGFGTFAVSGRKGRTGRNPQTGETLKIKAKTVAKFKPGKALSETVAKVKVAKAAK